MNRIAEFTRAEEMRIRCEQSDPLNDSDAWMREKIEGWRTANRNASEIGRGLLSLVIFINAAAVIAFIAVARGGDIAPQEAVALGQAVDFSLIGIVAGIVATVTGVLMHRYVLESATLDIVETWRNLNRKEEGRRRRARGGASAFFWITANFVVVSIVLFSQGAWIAKDALI